MNELNISSYIQIMQSGFITHDKQESAGIFLLESINEQDYVVEQGYSTNNLSSKKNQPACKPRRSCPRWITASIGETGSY